jgi:serine-type D-Ala-D-Ala carboxypeptidase/endopeptidase (penicillin-binding protein 4)
MRNRLSVVIAFSVVAEACASAQPPAPRRPSAAAPSQLRAMIDSVLDDARYRSATWGALIVDPVTGDTLYSRNAGKLLVPASNQKILTAAVALRELGAAFRFSTRVAFSGVLRDSVLNGDVIVFGTGDPSFSDRVRGDAMIPLREMADSLRAKGIVRVEGMLRRGTPRFTDSPIGFGWEWEDLAAAYGATVGDLMFNDAFSPVRVEVEGMVDTTRVTPRRYRNFLHAFETALKERGVDVRFAYDWNTPRSDSALTSLFIYQSPTLGELFPFFMKPSQNQIGEVLLKTLGLSKAGVGRADSGAAVIRERLISWGVDSATFVVRDGSGLSRHDLVTPETLVRVLDIARRDSSFRLFYDAMPVAGVDGTLERRLRGTRAEGNVHAKTGSMDRVRAFSGYVTTADGRMLIFSLIANGYAVPGSEIDKSMDVIVSRLADLHLAR